MGIGFPSTIPGGGHVHQPCIHAVLHVTRENAVFDENGIAGAVGITGDSSDNDEKCAVFAIETAGYTADPG